ncbi:MAG: NAD(P)H-dependent oxidoreductase subunit E [Burkholderiales bacterium]|nr:NAD(P)H-dependent oxidoreductase subunit E [Burkholderiales bacterium]
MDAASRNSVQGRSQLKGRQPELLARQEVRELIGSAPRRDLLIEHLHQLNDHYGALFERHLVALASEMRLALAQVYEVASFYHHFEILRDDQIAPALTVRVCSGLSCAMAGSAALRAGIQAAAQPSLRVLAAPCLGRCEQAPAVLIGQRALAHAGLPGVLDAVSSALEPRTEIDVEVRTPGDLIGYEAYRQQGGYALAAALVNGEQSAQDVIDRMEASGLRGLGGAGFPAGRKWRIVRGQSAPRLLAVNIDEGEPGTFKDRTYLERDPHRFLEGMLIAAQVAGTEACYIYLRDEYHDARRMLASEIEAMQADPPCPLPHIELRRGAGAYVCGEESAMIESIEGKRGEPRLRPPYLAEVGLFGRPTLEHNFETLYWVREILEKGPHWFNSFGRQGRHGLRSFSVSGRVKLPGVKLAPAGISVQELIDEHCGGMVEGHKLYAYLPGGASGGILPASLSHLALDFDTLQPYGCFIGSAAVVVLSQHDSARAAALNAMQFFAAESCGQCTPCRIGTAKAAVLMQAPVWDMATLDDLCTVMVDASICGLGQAAPNPVRCVQKYFAHEIGG